MHMVSTKEKDMIAIGPDGPGYKFIRKDYILEVIGVELTLNVRSRRVENNTEVINIIIESNKRNILGLAINRIN